MAKSEKADVPALAGFTAEQIQTCLVEGASLEQVKDLAEAGFQFEQIVHLAKTLGTAKAQGAGLSASDLRQVLVDQRKALRPENDRHPEISAFSHPEGNLKRPKPSLRRKTYFNGIQEQDDSLTPMEIDLYNRFGETRLARRGMWKADVRRNGSEDELWILTEPHTLDGRQGLPPLVSVLRELLDGEEAANPEKLFARVADLEARLKALTPAA